MLFSSNLFLFCFFPFVITGYYILDKKFRNFFLLLTSLLFYAWGEPTFVLVMAGSIVFNYLAALLISVLRRSFYKKAVLGLSVVVNLGILFIYKYLNFTITNLNAIGFDIPLKNIVLPLGISFFTFQAMSYVIDVYRGTVKVQKYLHNIGLYISFFPQLVAGPIVRYQTIAEQIDNRCESWESFSEGVRRFIIGFSKKIILSNNMALIADAAFKAPDAERSVMFAWLGAIAYSFQIFFDFSGYSDMAIGIGKMFGFHFLENFNYPYISKSVSEFWRRWHISLGQWFRDYVYFPLGGSRVDSKKRLVFNLFVVWFLTGVWHGASWNFIAWGLMYFLLIAFEKLSGFPDRFRYNWQKQLYRIFTMLCVVFGWVFFRAEGAKRAVAYCLSMIGIGNSAFTCVNVTQNLSQYWFFLLAAALLSTPVFRIIREKIADSSNILLNTLVNCGSVVVYLFLLLWSVSFIMIGSHNPFIYFNF